MRLVSDSISQIFVMPTICILCDKYHKGETSVCDICFKKIISLSHCCDYCAQPLYDNKFSLCGQCITKPPAFQKALINYSYNEPLRSLLHQFKYQEKLYLSSFLAKLIWFHRKNDNNLPECLIPVPLHVKRLKERGFNQAAEITKIISRKLKIPYQLNRIQKRIHTEPQAGLNKKNRQLNLKNAFTSNPIAYKHIALIDDIYTTGSTLNEISRILINKGVSQVDVWCCARA